MTRQLQHHTQAGTNTPAPTPTPTPTPSPATPCPAAAVAEEAEASVAAVEAAPEGVLPMSLGLMTQPSRPTCARPRCSRYVCAQLRSSLPTMYQARPSIALLRLYWRLLTCSNHTIQEYVVPTAAPLTTREKSQVSSYLLVCEQIHSGPLYTQTRTWNVDSDTPLRTYGQEQVNQRYGVKNKATVDPFFSMPMYSKRLERRERTLPDLSARPFSTSKNY